MAGKVRGRATRAFALGGKFLSGACEVPAEKVPLLVRRGLFVPDHTAKVEAPDDKGADTALPDDFPGAEHLRGAGYETLEAVRSLSKDKIITVKGIGPATAEKILEAAGGGQA